MQTDLSSVLQRTRNSLRTNGFLKTLLKLYPILVDRCFDIRHGVDTCAWAFLSELTIQSANRERGTRYQPSRLVPLRKLFKIVKHKIPPDSVFVDLGCGKGRVLLAASELGFLEVRGVEFAHELCEIAKKNCAIYKTKKLNFEYRIFECDVTDYAIKTDENVFFMYNPFDETILAKVLSRIAASLQIKSRRILVIYYNPVHAHILDDRRDFSRLMDFAWQNHKFAVHSNNI